MPFTITLGFETESDKNGFLEKVAPKVRGRQIEADTPAEADGLFRTAIVVTSQSAAKELCPLLVAFLVHVKSGRVQLTWPGAGGEPQVGEINAGVGASREADILAMRLGPAAKAFMDHEKAAS